MGGDGSSPRSERRRVSVAKQVPVLAPGSLVTKPQSLHTSHVLAGDERESAVTIAIAVHETPSWSPPPSIASLTTLEYLRILAQVIIP